MARRSLSVGRRVGSTCVVTAVLLLGACTRTTGPTNQDIIGQGAGLRAVAIADVPSDRDAPLVAVATSGRLVVFEGPALTGSSEERRARLWVYSPASGGWSDPLALDGVDLALVDLAAVLVDPATLVVAGLRCPNPAGTDTSRTWACRDGDVEVATVTVALGSGVAGVATVGPVVGRVGADGSLASGRMPSPVAVGWDGARVAIAVRSTDAAGNRRADALTTFDPADGSFAAGDPATIADRGLAVACGRPSQLAVGVRGGSGPIAVTSTPLATGGTLVEVRAAAAAPDVVACSAAAVVVRPATAAGTAPDSAPGTAGFDLVDLASGSTATIQAPGGTDATALALTRRQAVVVTTTTIAVVSTDSPRVELTSGDFLPATLTTFGADSYVRRAGARPAFTRIVNER